MNEWICAAQKLLDWIEDHAPENPSLTELARQVGYSPWYCSEQFHRIAGMTIREYMAKRRLSMAALALRDTDTPLTDIALEYGFSSQQALTRAFTAAYGCAPSAYRKNPIPLPLTVKKTVVTPSDHPKGVDIMSNLAVPSYRIEYIPAHRFLGVYERTETKDGPIWPAHDCDLMTGIVQSMKDCHPIVTSHTAGWKWENGSRKYFYGLGVETDYSGPIPEGFTLTDVIPASYYLVFNHPPFEYLTENTEVMKRVEEYAWSFDPETIGWAWNEADCQDYQRHYPEVIGYQVLRPVKKIN
ncbi:MAG: helix-turn-helix transcriptional regulator [Clostridia bacterium]|nr:helix-turn-helix transcriptional regulator [Clostridia bacterium]